MVEEKQDALHFHMDSGDNGTCKTKFDVVEKLNALVKKVSDKNPDEPTYESVRNKGKQHWFWSRPDVCVALGISNPIVYLKRWELLVFALFLNNFYWIGSYIMNEPNGLMRYGVILVLMYAYSDFKGGMLHVVLDTPSNIKFPFVGLPSLEFQFHHAIPQDIVMKGITQACGDLNTLAVQTLLVVAFETNFDLLALTVGSTILLCSYVGQFSHQATHKLSKDLSPTVKFLQKINILLPPHVHREHHQTHDKDFAILNGWSNPLLATMLKVLPQESCSHVWLGMFLFGAVFDCWIIAEILRPGLNMI